MPIEVPSMFYSIARSPILAVGIPVALGTASGMITKSSVQNWYKFLAKPPFQSPPLVFPIAWTLLYASMGIASHLIAKAQDNSLPGSNVHEASKTAMALYWIQYGLNLAWTPMFFGYQQVGLALLNVIAITGTTFGLTAYAAEADPRTTFLLAPYAVWLSYATYLNAGVWWLNYGPGKAIGGAGR